MSNELKRRAVVEALDLLDTAPEPEFDTIVDGAKQLFRAKSAFIALADKNRLWFKARCAMAAAEAPRDQSFCERAIAANAPLIIADTHADPAYAGSPFVTGAPFIRFYAGIPLHARATAGDDPVAIGTLCVIDDVPHLATAEAIAMLKGMALVVEALLDLRRANRESLSMALERHDTLVGCERVSRQLAQAERMANIGSWRLDLVTEEVSWSDQTYVIHGLAPGSEIDLSNALTFYPPADRARIAGAVAACAEHGIGYDLELDFTDVRGGLRRVRAIGEPELVDDRATAIIGVLQDITARHRMEQRLRELAQTDELTGLASRRAFNDLADLAIEEASASGEPVAVALLDLDHFKQVNDRLGHAAGDEVLRCAAETLRRADYLGDHLPARLGGDEFVILLRGGAAGDGLERSLERLLAELCQIVPHTDETLAVSATIGAARLSAMLNGRSALLKAADRALYRAKRRRRGTGAIDGSDAVIAARAVPGPFASAA